ncbi:hypothetical protein [Marinobacter sp.]|uniref:hypothetical protein n=1 Tax=Marinobacter sp. TaxID=50741 RepID=UPI00384FB6D5
MAANTATSRYVTSDFKATPVLALADLMGLSAEHKRQMNTDLEFYGSLLCGVAVHRHLDQREHIDVNRRINQQVPPSKLQSKLRELVVMQRVQPYWFMWSLNDEELRDFFDFNKTVAGVTGHILPSSPEGIVGGLTAAGVASAAYEVATKGARAAASDRVRALAGSGLVEAVARRLGVSTRSVALAGYAAIPIAIVIAGLNVMSKNSSDKARRELSARGLLAYSDL